jgi:hypothetical protein
MSDHSEEQEAAAQNHQIVERLREVFRPSELRLTHEVEPLVIFTPASLEKEVE